MATQTEVIYLDDLEHAAGREVPAQRTGTSFGIDGRTYEIDLTDENYQRLCETLAPFVAGARRAGTTRRPLPARVRAATTADREQNQAIREWAAKQGMNVAERGRIPAEVLDAYHARATNGSPVAPPADPKPETEPVPVTPAVPHFATKKDMNQAVREWAAAQGVQLAARGKLPSDVLEQYVHVHGEPVIG